MSLIRQNAFLFLFSITIALISDFFCSDIVRIELPEMEKTRNDLIVSINNDKQQLQMLEDKILKLLFSSKGNILDDDELVETLNESKETSLVIGSRLIDTEKTEEQITLEREKYRPLATKGAVLFFVASSLAEIDSMYQVSLRYFTQLFCNVIEEDAIKMEFDERLRYLLRRVIRAVYLNICRGLFERHKMIYSFLITTAVEKHDSKLTDAELDFLLRGAIGVKSDISEKPDSLVHISEHQWIQCVHLQSEYEDFKGIIYDLGKRIEFKIKGQEFLLFETSQVTSVDWNRILTPFKKLMLISVLKPELVMLAIR
jgi:dynein heavy chain, axonemal